MDARIPAGFAELEVGGEFVDANGPFFLRHDGQRTELGFRLESRHSNPMGICHGGMMATFCDMLLPLAAHRQVPQISHRFLLTISLQVDYLAPSPTGAWVQGEAQVLRTTRSLVFAQGLVSADGTPVARVSGVMKIGGDFPNMREVVG